MSSFTHTRACPTAETLHAYAAAQLSPPDRASVTRHLSNCDFCDAALRLLTAHPPVVVITSTPPVPLLVLLATGLLPQTVQPQTAWRQRAA